MFSDLISLQERVVMLYNVVQLFITVIFFTKCHVLLYLACPCVCLARPCVCLARPCVSSTTLYV